ncbi:F-box protein CPR1 isoform X2 [Medicago truncatula]|uniref:F-box protein CPR1 isoform X2 n=1 Tax=Medicago truncatula TaxID=3880 RepID=UPI000D2F170A|nr:F-box protein CPR1 isoform X2 [Medicago truncatula]
MASDVPPPELLEEILSRLPVKSLLQFRSTSKSLKSIIDSHHFINLHLKNSLSRSLIIQHKFDLYQLQIDDHDDFSKSMMIPLNHPFTTKITPVTRNRTRTMALIGSCNGLLAISHGQLAFNHPNNPNEITIWNPSTRKHRMIPFLPLPIPDIMESDNINRCCLCVHGFGFDPLTGDYKLLRISWLASPHNSFYDSHVRLFSSITNSWKIIPSMPYSLIYAQFMGVFVENSLHWIMTKKLGGLHPSLIVAFNLTLEIFNVVPLPDVHNSNESFEIDVDVLGGCLCMTYYETTKVDVWVMKEYGSRDSWCKLFTMVKSCYDLPLKSLRPLGYSSDGKKVLLRVDAEKLFWYDLKSAQVSYVEGIPDFHGVMFCVGSLVPPSFPVDNSKKKENRTSKSMRRKYVCMLVQME